MERREMSRFASTFAILNTDARTENEQTRRKLSRKLHEFATLPVGWSHGEGLPVSQIAIAAAEEFLFLAARLGLSADVFPNLDGGCAVTFYRDADLVEVSFAPGGLPMELRVERGIGAQFEHVI